MNPVGVDVHQEIRHAYTRAAVNRVGGEGERWVEEELREREREVLGTPEPFWESAAPESE